MTTITVIAHNERTYQSFPGMQYVLPSDGEEKKRLDLQHHILKTIFDNRVVFPSIAFSAGDVILDSGTGSGAWALDVHQTVPSTVQLQGIDISAHLFPSPATGTNLSFSLNSIVDLPASWSNKFALINQRLLIEALTLEQWRAALSEIHRTLKPGGWVQLLEMDGKVVRGGAATDALYDVVYELSAKRGLVRDCCHRIPEILKELGFEHVTVENRDMPLGSWAGELGVQGNYDLGAVYRGMKTPVLKEGGLGFVTTEAEYDALVADAVKEWEETEGASGPFYVMYAQKPPSA